MWNLRKTILWSSIGIFALIGTLLYLEKYVFDPLRNREKRILRFYMEALRFLTSVPEKSPEEACGVNFLADHLIFDKMQKSAFIQVPMVMTDANLRILSVSIPGMITPLSQKEKEKLLFQLLRDTTENPPIRIPTSLPHMPHYYIFYGQPPSIQKIRQTTLFVWGIGILVIVVLLVNILQAGRRLEEKLWLALAREAGHQFATPLSSLRSGLEQLAEDHDIETWLPTLQNSIIKLEKITTRFRSLSQGRIETQPVPIADLIRNEQAYLQSLAGKKITLTLIPQQESTTTVWIDPHLFAWALENVIINAIQAVQEKGQGTVYIRYGKARDTYRIEIEDTGVGIPPAARERLFEPGFTTKKGGWGIGLSLAKRVIQIHGGKIYLKSSRLQEGSTFVIKLPLRPVPKWKSIFS
ncbi:MAG: sensor histidine kinase [Bacteroidia bacterium]